MRIVSFPLGSSLVFYYLSTQKTESSLYPSTRAAFRQTWTACVMLKIPSCIDYRLQQTQYEDFYGDQYLRIIRKYNEKCLILSCDDPLQIFFPHFNALVEMVMVTSNFPVH